MRIHTTIPHDATSIETTTALKALLAISPAITTTPFDPEPAPLTTPLRRALATALAALPPSTLASLPPIPALISSFPRTYTLYPPLLLLPALPPPWSALLTTHTSPLTPLWTHLATALHCTHIALNAPIPASHAPHSVHARDAHNLLRSPAHLVPVHGDFGPGVTAARLLEPSGRDFEEAFWVQVVQRGVVQVWAPRWTMFSRGNVGEKGRVLGTPDTNAAPAAVAPPPPVSAAVDLYAGIGYFAFSYRRAIAPLVLGWEINPWSIEALRRGAAANNWRVWTAWAEDVWPTTTTTTTPTPPAHDFWLFAAPNETAPAILSALGPRLAVRHVNLGLLPLSRASWPAAVGALNAREGGWVHAHENVGEGEMGPRRGEVEGVFQRLVDGRWGGGRRVRVVHVQRVKMYAPGVVHAVFDVWVPGAGVGEEEVRGGVESGCNGVKERRQN
ncbi:S-adenosyl-L-methionine-dependent methyltransferase [Boeremia exigua]|uniref:S-adenosyl-L-methionine-dependent methyltransferase n=1 Tax=Boeremia exigua TaxID=749465 RepID=UPI001E8EDF9D|nr:S-adenosyl-L-methionine-dependent methyltransferase [Boeremia exigua]KAH6614025.1 S-adenosyl-L-methionine-dependent methyltransferase [Boeremia exigua]